MLPLLALPTGSPGKRQKTDAIFFKAFVATDFRKLSNLFGAVEWHFQAVKFRKGSGVREWMDANADKEWTICEFENVLTSIGANPKSYISDDGEAAAGIMPKLVSLIVRNPSSLVARKRVAYILGLEKVMTPSESTAWVAANVLPEIPDNAKDTLMLQLLRAKFQIQKYRDLLISTGDRTLHEKALNGIPNRYEFHPLNEERLLENAALVAAGQPPKWSEGGDTLGKLMTIVRDEINDE